MKFLLILFISFSFSANMLFINDNPDTNYFGQIEYALSQISMAYDYWDSENNEELNSELLNQYDLVFVFGNGTTTIPALNYDADNKFSSFIDQGGKLMLVDQNYFTSNEVLTDYDFQAGDFAYDYFGIGSAIVNPDPQSMDSTKVIGGPFPFQGPLVLHYDIYHFENSIDYITIGDGDGIFRQFPGSQWLGLGKINTDTNSPMSMYLSFAIDAVVKEGIACEDGSDPMMDCIGTVFCNDDPIYSGYDCVVGCENQWLGDTYCDDGAYGFVFQCDEFGWDCGDCGDEIIDPNGYCDDGGFLINNNLISNKVSTLNGSKSNPLIDINTDRDHATLTHNEQLTSLLQYIVEYFEMTSPPFIHAIDGPSGVVNTFSSFDISVNITDYQTDISSAQLNYSVNDGLFDSFITMNSEDGLTYTATLPGVDIPGAQIQYNVSATNSNGLIESSDTHSYSIFEVTSDVLLLINDTYEFGPTMVEYLNSELINYDRWLGGISSDQIPYYNTIFEIVPYFGSNYSPHISLINNWLSEGNKNYFVAGDDLAYLLGTNGINDSTYTSEMTVETGNEGMTEYFQNLGVELHVNDIQFIVSGLDYGTDEIFGYSSNPFPILAEEEDPISGALFESLMDNNTNLFISTESFGLYNYIDGIIPSENAIGLFHTGFNQSDEGSTGYNSQIATGVRNELNGNKTVYLSFNPYTLYSNLQDSLNTIHWGTQNEEPIRQAISWFGLETFDNIEKLNFPNRTKLNNAFPNPFNPVTHLSFNLESNENVELNIYNIKGEKLVELINGFKSAGNHSIKWDASKSPSGIYFIKLKTANITKTKKIILLK